MSKQTGRFGSVVVALLLGFVAGTAASAGPLSYPWLAPSTIVPRITEAAFQPPAGFRRVSCTSGSFCTWLRGLPLKPPGSPVLYFDGKPKKSSVVYAAVVDLDVGKTDLQQCADAVIRLRAEYLWAAGRSAEIEFPLTNGTHVPWSRWAAGDRVKVRGRFADWSTGGAPDASHENNSAYPLYTRGRPITRTAPSGRAAGWRLSSTR